jgi:hypothetical protein
VAWKPASDPWSIEEVLAHVVMIEQLYNGRTRRIAMENDPLLPKHLQPPASEKQKTAREDMDESTHREVCSRSGSVRARRGIGALLEESLREATIKSE